MSADAPRKVCPRCNARGMIEPFMSGTYWLQWCTKCGTLIEHERKGLSQSWTTRQHVPKVREVPP